MMLNPNMKMKVEECKLTLDEVAKAACPCILIDDSGTPGQRAGSSYLHPGRKTWVAVLVTAGQMAEVCCQLPEALDELASTTGATEFHFTDVYRGAGSFRNAPYEVRIAIFEFMRLIFKTYMFPVIVQTFDPRNIADMAANPSLPKQVELFDIRNPSDAALLFLLFETRRYLRENRVEYPKAGYVIMDEGFRPANRSIRIPTFGDVFKDSRIYTANSTEFCPIQLADYAAFCVARTQWLMTKQTRSRTDDRFLPIMADLRYNTINLPEVSCDLTDWSPADYERLVDEDRKRKGLKPYNDEP